MPTRRAQQGIIIPKILPIAARYYGYRSANGGTPGTTTIAANVLYAHPFWVPANLTADRLALNVTTAAAAGKLLRLGIYTATPAGLPDALLVDSGALAADTGAPFVASATISQALLAGVLYFLTVVSDGAPVVTSTTTLVSPLGADTPANTAAFGGYFRTFTYAALPTPWGTPAGFSTALAHIVVRAA